MPRPGNNFDSFWEAMYGPYGHDAPPPPPPRSGEGVDHAPPPPPPPPPSGLPPFMNPDFWNRWSEQQRRGWEGFADGFGRPGEGRGPWGHGPGGRHAHAHDHAHGHGRRRGGGGGRRHHGGGRRDDNQDTEERGVGSGAGPVSDREGDDTYLPEYITDDEVAAATAAANAEKKNGESSPTGEKEKKDDSPDTMMGEDMEDPPEEVPEEDEGFRPRQWGRHHHGRRGRGGFGSRRRGPGGPPPFGPFGPGMFGGFFGGPDGGPCRRRSRGGPPSHPHGPPPPFPPPFFEAFFGGPPPRGPHGHSAHHHRGPPPPPPPPPFGPEGAPGAGPFDFRGMLAALGNHPYAQHLREYVERAVQQTDNNNNHNNHHNRGLTPDSSDAESLDGDVGGDISPPLDLFEQADGWTVHLAVPGAKKEDVAVNWDADRSVLSVSGVVCRPGDEEFQRGLVRAERSVGVFSREVRLPPPSSSSSTYAHDNGETTGKAEVDAEAITARMESGVLVVVVPKVERDWTEVRTVEIE